MLHEKPASRTPTSHLVWCPGSSPSGQPSSPAVARGTRRRSGRAAIKAALRRAWQNVTVEHLAERVGSTPRAFAKALDMSEVSDPPARWLLDVEGKEFEDAIVEIRKLRAARERSREGGGAR